MAITHSPSWLLDTNSLLRWAFPQEPLYPLLNTAVDALQERGERVNVTPQVLIEFWNVCTRPRDVNGFGYTPLDAYAEVRRLLSFFYFAPDTADVFQQWLELVSATRVSGVQVHDARLVAVMRVHSISHILTLNPSHFTRYGGIAVRTPQEVASTA
jgi:predicted nucleic acid-binding protein